MWIILTSGLLLELNEESGAWELSGLGGADLYTPKVGQVFDEKFRILAELGAGGMGLVLKADQLGVGRIVALKFLKDSRLTDEESTERFYRECKLLSKLSHPQLMTVYGMALAEGDIPYAVCEFIDGKSLASVLASESTIEWTRALKITIQIAEAMSYAHQSGVIHRDLKPDNILLLSTPEPDFVKLIDFGLAKAVLESQDLMKLTQTGQLVGTANYMSPEIVRTHADQRADIYSLGCVLFEMISGEPLFVADSAMGVIFKHCNESENTRLASSLEGKVPTQLLKVLGKMLKKDPDLRYSNMAVLLRDLRNIAQNSEQLTIKQVLSWKPLAALSIILLIVFFASSQLISHQARPAANKYYRSYKQITLPKSGDSMTELVRNQKSKERALELTESWLETYYNRETVKDFDKLRVLYLNLETLYQVGKIDPESVLKKLADMEKLIDKCSPTISRSNRELLAIENNFLLQRLLFFFKNEEAVERTRVFLKNIKSVDDLIDFGGAVQQSLKLMISLGQIDLAYEFNQKWLSYYSKNPNVRSSQWYYVNMGDIALSKRQYELAKSYYLTAYRNSLMRIEGVNSNAVTEKYMVDELGVNAMSRIRVFEDDILHGLPEIAYRIYFFDQKKGQQLFKRGCQLMDSAAAVNSDIFTYMDLDSLYHFACFMRLGIDEMKILSHGVNSSFDSRPGTMVEPNFQFERQVAYAIALINEGQFENAKREFEKYKVLLLANYPLKAEKTGLLSSFASRMAQSYQDRGKTQDATYFYKIAHDYFAKSELKTIGPIADYALASFLIGEKSEADRLFELSIHSIPDYTNVFCISPGKDNLVNLCRLPEALVKCHKENLLEDVLKLNQIRNDCIGISAPALLFAAGKESYMRGAMDKASAYFNRSLKLFTGRYSLITGYDWSIGLQTQSRLFLMAIEQKKTSS